MKALDFPLLADENVHPDVIVFLRDVGLDVELFPSGDNSDFQTRKFYNKQPKRGE